MLWGLGVSAGAVALFVLLSLMPPLQNARDESSTNDEPSRPIRAGGDAGVRRLVQAEKQETNGGD